MAMNAYRAPQGSRRNGSEFPRIPVVIGISAVSSVVWLVLIATQGAGPMWESPLGQWMALRTDHFDLRNLLTYHFLHENWLHLLIDMGAIFYAGRLLEVKWGSFRFSLFYLASVVGSGLIVYAVGVVAAPDPTQACVSLGASGAALACLAASTLVVEDRPVLGFFTERYLVWSGMLLGAALMVLLEYHDRSAFPRTPLLLTPQLAGIALGAVLSMAIVKWDSATIAREERGRRPERVLDIRRRVDQILEKISRDGMGSLSPEEHSFLRDASKVFRQHQ